MECNKCKKPLMVSNSKYTTEVDSIEIYSELTLVCINPKCDSYCGVDLNNPLKVAKLVRNKVG